MDLLRGALGAPSEIFLDLCDVLKAQRDPPGVAGRFLGILWGYFGGDVGSILKKRKFGLDFKKVTLKLSQIR